MNKDKLIKIINSICPANLAEEWDNCGFQINCEKEEINRVLVSLEVTSEVIDEAIENNADLIITHHPLLFNGIKNIDYVKAPGKFIHRLIKAGISVYSTHTNFDKVEGGNNDYFGELLELKNIRPFSKDNGFCKKGETPFETTFVEVIHKAATAFDIEEKYFKFVGPLNSRVETIGWCTGAGSEFLEDAYKEGCDLYITGDLKYHEAMAACEMGLCILDAGHYGSEKIFTWNMADRLIEKLKEEGEYVEIMESVVDINPFE